ncbi:MAG TPA: amidohydrolase family protein [Candidatus Limnocylindria bacterium]|nr:amidohydrolase family protein [Candidatus Limnocylindria bacterium]
MALRGPDTRVVDLGGRMLLPGFIDAHTHFGNAAAWSMKIGLYDARDERAVLDLVAAAARRLPKGLWISGGDIGAADAWDADANGTARPAPMRVDRRALDAVTTEHPVLLRRIDGAYVANSLCIARARVPRDTPDVRGGRKERDASGELNGVFHGRAGERLAEAMPPANLDQQLAGARLALTDLARAGVTSIHDVARLDEVSQRKAFHTFVERSSTDLEIFRELQRRGELDVRVYAFLTLPLWRETVAAGIRPRSDEGRIRFGALKGFIDGYLMDEDYADRRGDRGDFTFRFVDEATMAADIAGADAAGFDPVVHCVGDRAHRLLLDWYEAAIRANPPRDRRFRVIHALYMKAREFERIGRLGLFVDITPEHMVRDLGTVERRLGPERVKTAHAWGSLARAGARVSIVSDWPGSYNEQRATPLAPLENIALAVGRQWHPEEAFSVRDAIEAYTMTPAHASYEEDRKGSITEGKLADLVVLSRDILAASASEIRSTRVDTTVLGGRVIYEAAQ